MPDHFQYDNCEAAGLDAASLLTVFDHLSDVYFFMKDRESRFIGANPAQLAKMGVATKEDLLGKSDYDFFPSHMIAQYHADDKRVMETGEYVVRRMELVANPDGSINWHVTSKFPLRDPEGNCIGVVGIMRDIDRTHEAWQPYQRMRAALDYISNHYAEVIEIADLAALASLSVSQFERNFRKTFEQTPARYIIRYRLTKASHLLFETDDTLTQIAHATGFYDHSHFSREFQKMFGMPPSRYRKAHA